MTQASAEKLEHTRPAEKERVASVPQRESRLCQKKKEQSGQCRALDREVGENQGEREPHLDEREGDENGSMERKGWTTQ